MLKLLLIELKSYLFEMSLIDTKNYITKKLNAMNLNIEKSDDNDNQSEIEVNCIYLLHDWGLWWRYGNKIIIQIKQISEIETHVEIYGMEDKYRSKMKKHEMLYDLEKILSKLKPPNNKPN